MVASITMTITIITSSTTTTISGYPELTAFHQSIWHVVVLQLSALRYLNTWIHGLHSLGKPADKSSESSCCWNRCGSKCVEGRTGGWKVRRDERLVNWKLYLGSTQKPLLSILQISLLFKFPKSSALPTSKSAGSKISVNLLCILHVHKVYKHPNNTSYAQIHRFLFGVWFLKLLFVRSRQYCPRATGNGGGWRQRCAGL